MTKKGKGRGKKTNSPKHLPSPSAGKGLSPTVASPQSGQVESEGEQSNGVDASEDQNSPVFVEEDNSEQAAESVTEAAQSQGPTFVVSGEVTTDLSPRQGQRDLEQQQLELGLNQIASYSKNNPVLSPLAPLFESNLNNIRDKNTRETSSGVGATQSNLARDIREENSNRQTRVNTTRSDIARETPHSDGELW